ncbi:MAG TPA: alpha-L-fucosidase [Rariglobus sp.]|jgi:alpha-L-fucosidase|nr:alpha-L-fucosidase [Rariglobus sp.]
MRKSILALLLFSGLAISEAQVKPPVPHGPVPTENQLKWQQMEFYAFIHLSLNTYTDKSWGFGNEDAKIFNPTKLDAREWVRVCKDAGMTGVIIVAKHHCGFCLWPSKYTDYSVKNSPWENGKGDVVRDVANACKEYGLKFGVYLSPWDRNRADYGKPEYITYFRNQLTELLTNYGPVFETWFDGANGGTGYYGGANQERKIDPKTYYDWPTTYALVRKLQPGIVIWNDGGDRADLRWVGTEAGFAGATNWSTLNGKGDVNWNGRQFGKEDGDAWVPPEVNTSIRPEWFYHPSEDGKTKTVSQLVETYYNSVGRNATLLLNFPIMPDGTIHPDDAKNALEMGKVIKQTFALNLARNAHIEASNTRGGSPLFAPGNVVKENSDAYWATDDDVHTGSLTIDLDEPTVFNRFLIQETIRFGQRVKSFMVEAFVRGNWQEIARGTTIGYKRILRFPSVTATKVRVTITDAKASPVISKIGLYNAPLMLDAPTITRNQAGKISIKSDDVGPVFYYTLNGGTPTPSSPRFTGPVTTDGKVEVRAIGYDPATGRTSAMADENFDICRKDWRILDAPGDAARAILDGDPTTAWKQDKNKVLPVDLVIDLGSEKILTGFKYTPDQGQRKPGVIADYEFYVSSDNVSWRLADKGEFSNIKNNRVSQIKKFTPIKGRYFKLRALRNTDHNNDVGYADVDVITD